VWLWGEIIRKGEGGLEVLLHTGRIRNKTGTVGGGPENQIKNDVCPYRDATRRVAGVTSRKLGVQSEKNGWGSTGGIP